jgi:hypothetical protein
MTDQDEPRFAELFESLCRAFGKPINAQMVTLGREYFEAMADYPLAIVERAKLTIVQGSKFFPRVRDWRQACDTARASAPISHAPLSRTLEDGTIERVFCCIRCEDSGWAPACGCDTNALNWRGECDRHPRTANGGLVYRQAMTACGCRDGNPVWQASRERVSGAAREAGGGRE